jgi:Tol biopolymer transport system component/predicted Ser/Thr protein kinase
MTAPQRIGSYPIERELGRGGMGIVYLGRDTRLGRAVAIKVLPEAFAADPERLARFDREAKLLAALHHPNIAGIHGLEESDGRRFLALEYVEGPTLAERLERGALPLDECLHIGSQIAAALEAAHEAGIIHRDLKPGNVKLTPAGDVKVLDFGLAKGAGGVESSPDLSQSPTMTYSPTGVGVILGTAAYMSPEQARGKVVDRRTDIWSFGCVLYEMLTGRRLFGGETVSDTIAKILEREPDWNALPAATPEKIRELLRRCLEKDARKRLRDIGDARIELEEAVTARSSKSRAAAAEIEAARTSRARTPWLAYGIALAALAVAAVAILRPMLTSDDRPTARLSITDPAGATFDGDAADCAISPDGRTVVMVSADSSGAAQLWVRPLATFDGHPIPGTDNPALPFWSPDSRWIAFFADGKLKKTRVGGGVETIVAAPNGRGGSWSPNGAIVYAPAGEGPLFAVSATGEPRQVTKLDSTRHETAHRFPWFLPDGKHFIYLTLPGGARGFTVKVGSIEGGPSRTVLETDGAPIYVKPGYLVYLHDRNLVAQRFDAGAMRVRGDPIALPDTPGGSQRTGFGGVTASANGTLAYMNGTVTNSRLNWYDRTGRVIGTVPVPAAQYQFVGLSPDERTLAVDRFVGPNESDLWMVDLARGVGTRFTYGPRSNVLCIWSPDGSRIAFESNRNGPYDIFVKAANGAQPETPLVVGGSQFKHPVSWTPDSRTLLFYQLDRETGFDIYGVPADGSGPPVPYLKTPFQESFPVVSPDGRWLLYNSDESGRPEEYVQSFPTLGQKYKVTTGGALLGLWRKDGKEIFIESADGTSTLSAQVLESGTTFQASPPRLLFHFPFVVFGLAATRDGQRFIIPTPEGKLQGSSITIAFDWKADLAAHAAER